MLVTFPAVSGVLTSASQFGFTATEYGGMFVPQAATAILASFLGAGLNRRLGHKRIFLLGLAADVISMLLLLASRFVVDHHMLAFGILLTATGFLGVGFGLAVPALNTFVAAFFPHDGDRALLYLNALLGLGTALAPVFAFAFVGLGIWWGLPLVMSILAFGLLLAARALPLDSGPDARPDGQPEHRMSPGTGRRQAPARGVPAAFWLYAAFALLYGVCETMNGNWAPVYLTTSLGASAALGSLALTVFWSSVTGGRVLFAAIERWLPQRWTFRGVPLLLAVAFVWVSLVPASSPVLAVVAFGVAGLGCSALLPLVISFGQGQFPTMAGSIAGALIGFYEIGYGVAAFGVGPMQTWGHIDLTTIYCWMPMVAIALAALGVVSVRRFRTAVPGGGERE